MRKAVSGDELERMRWRIEVSKAKYANTRPASSPRGAFEELQDKRDQIFQERVCITSKEIRLEIEQRTEVGDT